MRQNALGGLRPDRLRELEQLRVLTSKWKGRGGEKGKRKGERGGEGRLASHTFLGPD